MTDTIIEVLFIVLALGILLATTMKLYPRGDWLGHGPSILGLRLRPLVFQIAALQILITSSSSLMRQYGAVPSEVHSLAQTIGQVLKIVYIAGFIAIIVTGNRTTRSSNQAL